MTAYRVYACSVAVVFGLIVHCNSVNGDTGSGLCQDPDSPRTEWEKKEFDLCGRITGVERIDGSPPTDSFQLGIDLVWLIEIEIKMIEENPAGLVSGEKIRLAMSSLLASTLGVFWDVDFDEPRFYLLSFRKRNGKSVPMFIRVGPRLEGQSSRNEA